MHDRTTSAIRSALSHLTGAACELRQDLAEMALDYLDAVIPADHPGRVTLLRLADMHRRLPMINEATRTAIVESLVKTLTSQIDGEPITFPTFTSASGLARLGRDWHESDIDVRMVGRTNRMSGGWTIDNATNAGHMEPTLVFYDDYGVPVGQVNLANLLELATTDTERTA